MGPRFSIIVPTRNRVAQLHRCISAIAALEYPPDQFETIVVDDGGDIANRDSLPASPAPVRVLCQEHAGPAAARNRGAEAATGEFLVFLDDDCAPRPDWLRALEAAVRRWPGHLLGGRVQNALPSNPFSAASQLLIDFLYAYYNKPPRRPFVASCNLCVPAALFRELGGFSTAFPLAAAEDRDFCDEWNSRNLPIRLVEEPVVEHAHDLDLRRFWGQHFGYGAAAPLYHTRKRERRGEGQRLEPVRFYIDLVLWPFRREPPAKASLLSVLLILSQAANAAGYFRAAMASVGDRTRQAKLPELFRDRAIRKAPDRVVRVIERLIEGPKERRRERSAVRHDDEARAVEPRED
jgi:glycosyltransferase involved in cell wall biosynthesis